MEGLFRPINKLQGFNHILSTIGETREPISITGLFGSQKAHIVSAIIRELHKPSIFVTVNEIAAKKFYQDFRFFLGEQVLYYPSKEIILHSVEAEGLSVTGSRLLAIEKMLTMDNYILVVSIEGLLNKVVPLEVYKQSILNLKAGSKYNINQLLSKLLNIGYQRTNMVEGEGQFSIRGGILDIYPVNASPCRIDFFGDEVESIKIFDIISQRSISEQSELTIFPTREIIFDKQMKDKATDSILSDLDNIKNKTKDLRHYAKLEKTVMHDVERLRNGIHFAGIEKYISYFYKNTSFIDYLPNGTLIFLDEYNKLGQTAGTNINQYNEMAKTYIENSSILPQCADLLFQFDEIVRYIETKKVIHMSTFAQNIQLFKPSNIFNISSKPSPSFNGKVNILIEDIKQWKPNNRIIVLAGSKTKAERLIDYLSENEVTCSFEENLVREPEVGEVVVVPGTLYNGFEYSSINYIVISDREILGEEKRKRRRKAKAGQKIKAFSELNSGDYVVHQIHGIGQYAGIEKLKVEGIVKDYFKIKYLKGHLYVPVNQLDLIQKYIGSEGKPPRINRLGGADWHKAKLRVKASIENLAKELIKLYAEREMTKGFAYPKDNIWQRQFEETFPYEETDDQLQCIIEVKDDMERDRPMDRLLCGDVGYGKTEIAIRAAFKAVMGGKQVAYLVPTTILAQQHFNNFVQRMRDFPVRIEMLSRFRTQKQQKTIIKELKEGLIDIIIGTHRILQKDIAFKGLGLVIVDEEQRFGVTHKEKLKSLKKNVDVLTLTATPIPRTMHMALIGVRDMSTIEEPPEERYPIQTYVLEHDNEIVKEAIVKEISRGGQVFYLHNRISSISKVASLVQKLVPEARVVYAHGQMTENELEDIIMDFLDGKYDVLVCTTIIESGIDMPNVNTIIIEDADRMGLAQLYQLRGRVGRSNRQAYAFFTFRKDKVLSEEAEKRLKAIKEFTEFGSGFKIAMKDLEIRGAGNLIGPEQHGHMNSVGYEMYCKILEDTIRELRGEKVWEPLETTIDINISGYIDDKYISDSAQKIIMYKKIASIENEEDVYDVKNELIDRYGEIPKEVDNLIQIAYIKALCIKLNIISVTQKYNNIIISFSNLDSIDLKVIGEITNIFKRRILFTASDSPYITFKVDGIPKEKLLENIKILLQNIKKLQI